MQHFFFIIPFDFFYNLSLTDLILSHFSSYIYLIIIFLGIFVSISSHIVFLFLSLFFYSVISIISKHIINFPPKPTFPHISGFFYYIMTRVFHIFCQFRLFFSFRSKSTSEALCFLFLQGLRFSRLHLLPFLILSFP